MKIKKVMTIGFYDNGTGKHQSNTVYSGKGISIAMTTLQGGTQQIKVLKQWERRKNR